MRRKAVVDEQDGAALEDAGETPHERARRQMNFGLIVVGQLEIPAAASRAPSLCGRHARTLRHFPPGYADFLDGAVVRPHDVHWNGVEHFVADDDAVEVGRQHVQPSDFAGLLRRVLRDPRLLTLAQIGADFENEVVVRRAAQSGQFGEQAGSERAAAGADLQNIGQSAADQLGELTRQAAAEERGQFRRGDKSPSRPSLRLPAL